MQSGRFKRHDDTVLPSSDGSKPNSQHSGDVHMRILGPQLLSAGILTFMPMERHVFEEACTAQHSSNLPLSPMAPRCPSPPRSMPARRIRPYDVYQPEPVYPTHGVEQPPRYRIRCPRANRLAPWQQDQISEGYPVVPPPSYTPSHTPPVERLRRFLSFTLAIDYGLEDCTPDRLSASDWAHFVRLAAQFAKLCPDRDHYKNWFNMDDWLDIECPITRELRYSIWDPAVVLGLERWAVVYQLRLFISSIHRCRDGAGYRSQLEQMLRDQGLPEFARKLCYDRNTLMNTVLPRYWKAMSPHRSLRALMLARNVTVIDKYFKTFDSQGGYVPFEKCRGHEIGVLVFASGKFKKETKKVVGLVELLESDVMEVATMGCWRKWKWRTAKMRESSLYVPLWKGLLLH